MLKQQAFHEASLSTTRSMRIQEDEASAWFSIKDYLFSVVFQAISFSLRDIFWSCPSAVHSSLAPFLASTFWLQCEWSAWNRLDVESARVQDAKAGRPRYSLTSKPAPSIEGRNSVWLPFVKL
jgi:hypothetical protein